MELDVQWLQSVEQRLSNLAQAGDCPPPPSICRIPKGIRDVQEDAYEPKMISIGPYHRGREHLKAMETHKWRYLHKFLSRQPNLRLHELLRAMQQLEGPARSCYLDTTDQWDRNQFVEMMTVDGCFIIEFMNRTDNLAGDPLFSRSGLSFLLNDLLLLENQIPFLVLNEIWALYCGSNDHQHELELIHFFVCVIYLKSPIHSSTVQTCIDRFRLESMPHHLLDLFHSFIAPIHEGIPAPIQDLSQDFRSTHVIMPSASLLKNSSVKFRAAVNDGVLQMSFAKGWMDLSVLTIGDCVESLLRNLIAYEQCFSEAGDMISSYMSVMDSLIDTADDVAVLKESGILRNMLGSDEEVALLFNRLCKNIGVHLKTHIIHHQVSEYCSKKHRKWRAQLLQNYFGNPWAIISVAAAVTLLLLTLIQAIFSILSFKE